ncbi:uncharacterized protein LOC141533474 isoform X2 [Cotesia typhae]|uniref:uncharacterized protein LOC141533474 isoform X2 n=1 Tax=Cotesia typhae TaxID=2053667 RepID=UPI003D6971D6
MIYHKTLVTVVVGKESHDLHFTMKYDDVENIRQHELILRNPTKGSLMGKKSFDDDLLIHSNLRKTRKSEQSLGYRPFTGSYGSSYSQDVATKNSRPMHSDIHYEVRNNKESYTDQEYQRQLSYVLPNYSFRISDFSQDNAEVQSPTYESPTMFHNIKNFEYATIVDNPNLEKIKKKEDPIPSKYEQDTHGILVRSKSGHSRVFDLGDSRSQKPLNKLYYRNPEYQQYHVELTNQKQSKTDDFETVQNNQHVQLNNLHSVSYVSPSKYRSSNTKPKNIESHNYSQSSAQAQAEAQALEFQKISHSAHLEHQRAALHQIRLGIDKHNQQTALEQINQGHLSDAGKKFVEKNFQVSDPEQIQQAQFTKRISEQVAETRKNQEASEYKAHSDAIIALQKQQAAHLKAQEDAHIFALNFEQNQVNAQAKAQALANAQAVILYKAHRAAHAKAQNEAKLVAQAQANARYHDPEHTPVIQYLLPQMQSLPDLSSQLSH